MTGMRSGRPEPFLKRPTRATSKLREACGAKSSIRQTLAVVPPMSNESTRPSPLSRATLAENIAPPAGPLSTSRIGKRQAVSIVVRLPPESIIRIGVAIPYRADPALADADSAPSAAARRRWRPSSRSAPIPASRARPRWPERDRDAGQSLSQDLGRPALVVRIDEAMQKADGDAFDFLRARDRARGRAQPLHRAAAARGR